MPRIKLVGVLRGIAGFSDLVIETEEPVTVQNLIRILVDKIGSKLLEDAVIDRASGDPRPNLLVLVDDKEISTLGGLQTTVEPKGEMILIPVAHGGVHS